VRQRFNATQDVGDGWREPQTKLGDLIARTGGAFPYDKLNALEGLARVLWAPLTVATPTGLPIASVATAGGEYTPLTGWIDLGLAAGAPTYTHGREEGTLEYQQSGVLFRKITSIERSFTCNVAEIEPENLKIIENATQTAAVAATAGTSAAMKVFIGRYSSLASYRIALVSYRPDGAGVVVEPAPSSRSRPPLVALVLPNCTLAAEDTDMEWDAGSPVSAEITFNSVGDQSLGAGKDDGYWYVETAGTIT
jgi:hypothetical protein